MAIFDPPQNPHPLTDRQKLVQVIAAMAPTAVPNLVQIRPWRASGQMAEIKRFFYLYLFFGNSPTGQTRLRIFALDGSNNAHLCKGVPFEGFVDTAPYFRGEIPKTPIFGLCE